MRARIARSLRVLVMALVVGVMIATIPSTALALSPLATIISTAASGCDEGTVPAPASPDDLDGTICIEAPIAGTPGETEEEGSGDGGGSTEPRVCKFHETVLPCSSAIGYWNDAYNCYLAPAMEVDTTPRPTATAVWYRCVSWCEYSAGQGTCISTSLWLEPWIANNTVNPAVAAGAVIARFALQGVDIGFAPDPGVVGSRGYVGMPVWMWVNNVTPLNYGPYSVVEEEQGVTVTANAQVTSIRWSMGDGHIVPCAGTGMPYQPSLGVIDSPSCGHRYQTTSADQAGGRFTITATSSWQVNWDADGVTGSQTVERSSSINVEIRELQSVNVGGGPG